MDREVSLMKGSLRRNGITDDIAQAVALLAGTIADDAALSRLLGEIPVAEKHDVYEALRPHLGFKAKPLDVYVAEAGKRAEADQLPLLDAGGRILPFKPARNASTDVRDAEAAIAASIAESTLILRCAKCTRVDKFHGVGRETKVDVILKARREGWVYDYQATPPVEICPECPTSLSRSFMPKDLGANAGVGGER